MLSQAQDESTPSISSDSSSASSTLPNVIPSTSVEAEQDLSAPLSSQLIEPVDTNETQSTAASESAAIATSDPLVNFRSLAGAVEAHKISDEAAEHVEQASPLPSTTQHVSDPASATRTRGDSGESSGSSTAPPQPEVVAGHGDAEKTQGAGNGLEDTKHCGDVSVLDQSRGVGQTA